MHFGHQQVFENATTYTCLLFLEKGGEDNFSFAKIDDLKAWSTSKEMDSGIISAKSVTPEEWNFVVGNNAKLFERLNNNFQKLGEIATIFVGIQTSADDIFILDFVKEMPGKIFLKSKSLNSEFEFETDLFHPLVSGTDVKRYTPLSNRQYLLFPYTIENDLVNLIDYKEIERKYPKIADYLLKNKKTLESRENGKMRGSKWYGYIYLKNMAKQSIEKICVPRLVDRLYAAYDIGGNHFLDNVDVGGITLDPETQNLDFKYLLGLINSKLLQWFFPFVSAPFRGGWYSANKQFLSQIPIRTINFADPADKARHDRMVTLVTQMLDLNKKVQDARLEQEKTLLSRQIEATNAAIDKLVYELYGLTDDEIAIVEGTNV